MQCLTCSTQYTICTSAGPWANIVTAGGANLVHCGLGGVYYIGYDCAQTNVIFMYHDTPTGCCRANARVSFYCANTNNCLCYICTIYPTTSNSTTWQSICCTYTFKCMTSSGQICCATCCATIPNCLCLAKSWAGAGCSWTFTRPISSTCNTYPVNFGMLSFIPCNGNLCSIVSCNICDYMCCAFGVACSPDPYTERNSFRTAYCANIAVGVCISCNFPQGALTAFPYNSCCFCEMPVSSTTNHRCFIGIAASTAVEGACCRVYLPSETTPDIYCCLTPGSVFYAACNFCHWSAVRIPDTSDNNFLGTTGCASCMRLPIAAANTRVYIRT